MMFELANTKDSIELANLDIDDLNEELKTAKGTNLERVKINIGKKHREIENLKINLAGRMRECDTLYAMLKEIPKVSLEELEKEEEEYWSKRLSRQYFLSQRDSGGNLSSILGMLTEPGKPRPEIETEINHAISMLTLSNQNRLKDGR